MLKGNPMGPSSGSQPLAKCSLEISLKLTWERPDTSLVESALWKYWLVGLSPHKELQRVATISSIKILCELKSQIMIYIIQVWALVLSSKMHKRSEYIETLWLQSMWSNFQQRFRSIRHHSTFILGETANVMTVVSVRMHVLFARRLKVEESFISVNSVKTHLLEVWCLIQLSRKVTVEK